MLLYIMPVSFLMFLSGLVVHPHQKPIDCFDPLHASNDDAFNWIWLDCGIICAFQNVSNLRLYICTEEYHHLKQTEMMPSIGYG